MQKSLLLLMAMACCFSSQARHLSPAEALSRATGSTSVNGVSVQSRGDGLSLSYSVDMPDSDAAGVYVFTRPDGNGFLVVSADDSTEALLGYSDSGTFDTSSIPPALKSWLDEYACQVAWASDKGDAVPLESNSLLTSTKIYRAPVAPLCATKWNQDAPYYNMCPMDSGRHCYTGCVATAMSQVMKYHNWPEKGNGSKTYTTKSLKKSLTLDFSSIEFDWANMLDTYSSGASDAQNEAVAQLMYAAGVSVGMDYSTTASGAAPVSIPSALVNYFGYATTVTFNARDWYGIDDWNDLIYNSLVTDGPVILGGYSEDAGHCFVCDGYSTDNYFHINWGWSGMSDGYFLLTALNPGQQGIGGSSGGYNFNQDAITGIRKPSVDDQPGVIFMAENLSGKAFGKTVTVKGYFFNQSVVNLTDIYCGLDIDGRMFESEAEFSSGMKPDYGYYSRTYDVDLSALTEGTHKAYPVFRCNESSSWQRVKMNISQPDYLEITVSEDGGISVMTPDDVFLLSSDDLNLNTPMSPGEMFNVTATVTNSGEQEFVGSVYLVAAKTRYSGETISEYPVDIEPGSSMEISIDATLPESFATGDYTLYLMVENYDTSVTMFSNGVEVTVTEAVAPEIEIVSATVQNEYAVDLDNITINVVIANGGGNFYDSLTVAIFKASSDYSVSSFTTIPVEVVADSDGTSLTLTGSYPDGQPGEIYYLIIYDGENQLSDPIPFKAAETSGFTVNAADIDNAVEFYTLTGLKVASPSPGNIYIKVMTGSDGTRSSRKVKF